MIISRKQGKYEITNISTGKTIVVDDFYGFGIGDVSIVRKDGKQGVVNLNGTLVINTTNELVLVYDEDIIVCRKGNGKYILRNNKGKKLSKLIFESAEEAIACGAYLKGIF